MESFKLWLEDAGWISPEGDIIPWTGLHANYFKQKSLRFAQMDDDELVDAMVGRGWMTYRNLGGGTWVVRAAAPQKSKLTRLAKEVIRNPSDRIQVYTFTGGGSYDVKSLLE